MKSVVIYKKSSGKWNPIWVPQKKIKTIEGFENRRGIMWYKYNGHWYPNIPQYVDFSLEEGVTNWEFPESYGDWVANAEEIPTLFASEEDGDPVVLTFDNLTVPAGITLTPTNRCKGLYIKVNGDLTLDGSISMTARGAHAEGKFVGVDLNYAKGVIWADDDLYTPQLIHKKFYTVIGAIGGPTRTANGAGNPGVNNACGSGGGGGVNCTVAGWGHMWSFGGNGTSFSGGAGGGGINLRTYNYQEWYAHGSQNGGPGANGYDSDNWTAGGGAGNPGGFANNRGSNTSSRAESGTGGLLILIVNGDINIGSTGQIISNGSKGCNGSRSGGGGSGGGSVHVYCNGVITNRSKITATGGANGTAVINGTTQAPGYVGGKGTVKIISHIPKIYSPELYNKYYGHKQSDIKIDFEENT